MSNGEKYVGEYKDNNRNGQGTQTFPDGGNYVGEYKNNFMNGQGTHTTSDGVIKSGLWEDDEFVEQ